MKLGLLVIFLLVSFQTNISFSNSSMAGSISFFYSTSDGGFQLTCQHWQQDIDLPDWDVVCGKGTPTVKKFKVHWVVKNFSGTPNRMQILYWIIDRNQMKTEFSSQTNWYEFKQKTDLPKMKLSQSIENDAAYLEITYQP